MADRAGRRDAAGDHASQQAIEVPLVPEVIGEDVISDQAPVVPQLAGGQRGQDRVEAAGDRAFADLNQQAEGSPDVIKS